MKIHHFVFNPYQVNTYVVSDNSGECVVIDPACGSEQEQTLFFQYLDSHHLKPVMIVNTHGHFDHVIGNARVAATYQIPTAIHPDDVFLFENTKKQGELFGYTVDTPPAPSISLVDGGSVCFGESELNVFHTPGHSPGGVALYAADDQFIIVGDVLFQGSIGRTDLPGGDYDQLMDSIYHKLLVLPRLTKVYTGHGPSTTLENEILNNPFLMRLGC